MPPSPHSGAPGAVPIPARAGVGLRFAHHEPALSGAAATPWFEVHPENYLAAAPRRVLEQVRALYPVSLHATGLSLGSADGVDPGHLAAIAALAGAIEPGLVSDHLSWSAAGGLHAPDLLPSPYTEEALEVFAANIEQVQGALRRPILIENPSVYFSYAGDDHAEADFLAALVRRSGCGVLLDVNNVVVSARNLGEAPAARLEQILAAVPAAAIQEIHLAGHSVHETEDGTPVRIDDHGSPVSDEVLALYRGVIARLGPRPTLIEWDTRIPPFATLLDEQARVQAVLDGLAGAPASNRERDLADAG